MRIDNHRLIESIASIGKKYNSCPELALITPFHHYFNSNNSLDRSKLDLRDGSCTRRELLARFLLLNAVIDQGPDIIGVRKLLTDVTNELYLNEIRFIHRPAAFFEEIGIAVDQILEVHETVKKLRSLNWARDNQSRASKYNLFMDNTYQVLNYAIFRWGVPLALPLLLDKDVSSEESRPTVFIDYLESWPSAEEMSNQIKSNVRYGLGKAIGNKACHLFAKWYVTSFGLTRRIDKGWGPFSYEAPFDSNAGRVLWRTGFFLNWATEEEYRKNEVIQIGRGKGGVNYIRVTNIRGMKASVNIPDYLMPIYKDIAVNLLRSHKKSPKKIEIQRIPSAFLIYSHGKTGYSIADLDEGLIYIGTKFCYNHDRPLCGSCPISNYCAGYQYSGHLISEYRT